MGGNSSAPATGKDKDAAKGGKLRSNVGSTVDNRIAAVTGGIGGLGTAICRSLAAQGRTVVAIDLGDRDERLEAFPRETAGLDIHFSARDASDFDSRGRLVENTVAAHRPLHILANPPGPPPGTHTARPRGEEESGKDADN